MYLDSNMLIIMRFKYKISINVFFHFELRKKLMEIISNQFGNINVACICLASLVYISAHSGDKFFLELLINIVCNMIHE